MLLSNTTFFYFVFGSGDESLLLKIHFFWLLNFWIKLLDGPVISIHQYDSKW